MLSALKIVSQRSYPAGTILIYYCDNTTALKVLTGDFATVKTAAKWSLVTQMAYEYLNGLIVDARHVPAHTGKDELKRYFLNRWCDYNARAMMKYNRLHVNTKMAKRRGRYIH